MSKSMIYIVGDLTKLCRNHIYIRYIRCKNKFSYRYRLLYKSYRSRSSPLSFYIRITCHRVCFKVLFYFKQKKNVAGASDLLTLNWDENVISYETFRKWFANLRAQNLHEIVSKMPTVLDIREWYSMKKCKVYYTKVQYK